MKIAILVILGLCFWQSPGARRASAVVLRDVANFVQPEPQSINDKIKQFNTCLQ